MPRIPVNYRKYLLEREFRNRPPEFLEEILAPNARKASGYAERYYADPSSVRFREVYGPYMPSEERMIRPPEFNAALQRELKRRKEELWRQYMEEEDPPPGIGWPVGKAEQLDKEFELGALEDLEYELDTRRSNKPILRNMRFRDIRWNNDSPPPRYDFMAPTSEAARDRLRMQGIDGYPWPEDSPFNRYR